MKINPLIFRAYDIRGISGKDLTKEVFQKIGLVLGRKKGTFLIGHDIRKSGRNLALALISGLNSAGVKKVFFCGESSFGLCLFSGWKLKVDKTLFVTASHLPKEWNGLKPFYGDGEPFSQKDIEKIRNEVLEIEKKKIRIKKPIFKKVNFKKDYIKTLVQKFPSLKNANLKIVLDCGGGSTALVAPQIFKEFGFKTIKVFCKPDPEFRKRDPEPTLEATKTLRKRVLKEKADFGIAFDGDGDRVAIIDDKGRYLDGNKIGIILGKNLLLENKQKIIIKTVSCSMALEEEFKPLGAKIIESPVGHSFVVSACKKYKAILGIEESNHFAIPKYFLFDDGVIPTLKMAEILIKTKKNLSQIIDEIKTYRFKEIVFDCPDEVKFEVVKNLAENFKKRFKKVNDLDGVKVYFDFGWILIRASNTSPKIRLYLEAKTKNKFNFLKENFSKILKKCIQQLS